MSAKPTYVGDWEQDMDAWEAAIGRERGNEMVERLEQSGLQTQDADQTSVALCIALRALAIIAHNDQPPWIPHKRTPTQVVTHQLVAGMAIEVILDLGKPKKY